MTDSPNNKQPAATLQEHLQEALADPVRRDIDRRLALLEQQVGSLQTSVRTDGAAVRSIVESLASQIEELRKLGEEIVQRNPPLELDAERFLEPQDSPRHRLRGALHAWIDRVLS